MKTPRFFSLAVALVLAGSVFTGCTESSFESTEAPIVEEGFSKMRQSHLFRLKFLSRHKVLERYEELVVTNDFVLGLSDPLQLYRVLERYEQMDGVRIKTSYKKAIHGFAAHAADAEAFLAIVEADDDIAWVEPDVKFKGARSDGKKELNSAGQALPNGVAEVGGPDSWAVSGDMTGSVDGVEVYVMDTGVSHPDLNIVEFVNFADDEPVVSEVWDHGTHVASTIAAIDDDDYVVGVAPGAGLHVLRVLNNTGRGELSAAIAAVDYVTLQKKERPSTPMVVNLSFGFDSGTTEYNALDEAIEKAIKKGVVFVIAAGNDAIDVSTVSPAHVATAITVGAAVYADTSLATFSNYGSLVDIVAPGQKIKGLVTDANAVKRMSGTSMAAPHATGAAALYLANNPEAAPGEVANALRDNARDGGVAISGVPANTTDLAVWVGLTANSLSTTESTAELKTKGGKGGRRNK